jgi:GT2 family glycosyltransferase
VAEIEISVVVLAFGPEPYLSEVVRSVLDTTGGDVEILLIDNGAPQAVGALLADERLQVFTPPANLGYAGGCNYGAARARGQRLVFLNSDAVCLPGSVAALVAALSDPSVGIASGDVRLADAPELMNSAGNPVHYLGVVWAGGYGEPAAGYRQARDVAAASGAFLGVRRDVWDRLDGFDDRYFAYHEDTDLSLRAWQAGLRVVFVPAATVLHHYEFSRTASKQYLLERNRWLTVLTVYPTPLLLRLLPSLLAFDLALLAVAAVQGWAGAKVRGWVWLVRHARHIRRRRDWVQAASRMRAGDFATLLSTRIEPAMIERPPGTQVLNVVLEQYWRLIRRTMR